MVVGIRLMSTIFGLLDEVGCYTISCCEYNSCAVDFHGHTDDGVIVQYTMQYNHPQEQRYRYTILLSNHIKILSQLKIYTNV
jgi:hypothetical protein